MTNEQIKKFSGLFKAITLLRTELNIFGYEFDILTIRKGDSICDKTEFPDKLGGLKITLLRDKDDCSHNWAYDAIGPVYCKDCGILHYMRSEGPKEKEEQNIYIKVKDTKGIDVKCIEKEGDTEEFDLGQPENKAIEKITDEELNDCKDKNLNIAFAKLIKLMRDKQEEIIDRLNSIR